MARLIVRDVEKWFQRENGQPLKILDRLSFEALEGCVTVVIGPSGCGKSTLLNAIVGLERIDRGELVFLNDDVHLKRPSSVMFFKARDCFPGELSAITSG